MRPRRSRKTLWWGIGFILLGLAGMSLFHVAGPGIAPFTGWGGGGIYDKGSYSSNGERIYYLGIGSEGKRIPIRGGPHWLYAMGGSCVNCHGQDGSGGFPIMMGTKVSSDIRYERLVSRQHNHEDENEESIYTEEDIRRAITDAVMPSGKPLDSTMPSWKMSEEDLSDLINFLKTLD
jgi:mono/diheme cytochrome c family protein